jgi:hypothetical protein
MAVMRFKGMEEYVLKLSKLAARTEEVAGKAIYAGAAIVADAIKSNIETLPVNNKINSSTPTPFDGLLSKQKDGLIESFGISPLGDKDGVYNVKLGFDGYNAIKTKKYPKGQPNQLIARAVESGSSVRVKHPFVDPAVKSAKAACVKKMQEVIDTETEKTMKQE